MIIDYVYMISGRKETTNNKSKGTHKMKNADNTKPYVTATLEGVTRQGCIELIDELAAPGVHFFLSIDNNDNKLEISKTQLKKYIKGGRWINFYSSMKVEIKQRVSDDLNRTPIEGSYSAFVSFDNQGFWR